MEKNSKIFVTGHKGLVGHALTSKLKENGYENILIQSKDQLDLRNQSDVSEFFKAEKPNYVFLAAAKVGGIYWNRTCPAEFIYDNLQIQNNVIHSSYLNGVKKLMFFGSSCIYPKNAEQPMKEECLLSGQLEPTNEAYALAKIAGLKMCQFYKEQYGFNAISIMPTNLYGLHDKSDLDKCHVIPAMIHKFINARDKNEPVYLFGDGSPKREFLFAEDLADACVFIMEKYDDKEIINVGSSEECTIKTLAEIIKKYVGYNGDILWDTSKPNGSLRKKLCTQKLSNLGWVAKTKLEDGLRTVIKESNERVL